MVGLPRSRGHGIATVGRSGMLGALVIGLPIVLRLPALGGWVASDSPWRYLAPPVWFLGCNGGCWASATRT